MKRLLMAVAGTAALLVSGLASAIPYTTGLTLSEATASSDLCLNDCNGTITIDFGVAGGAAAQSDGFYDIIAVNITIDETVGGNPELVFGDVDPADINYVQVIGGEITTLFASVSTNNLHELSFNGTDWGISGNAPALAALGLDVWQGGGSATKIPEPASLALFGMGLLAFGAASKRKGSKKA